MRLIDTDNLDLRLSVPSKNNAVVKAFADEIVKEIQKQPTVEAISIDYIEGQIRMYDAISKKCDDMWSTIYGNWAQLLRGLIEHWRKDNG